MILVCPFCGSPDIDFDEDYIIISCPFCGESEGYQATMEES